METQGGKLDFPRRKRGVDAAVGKAQKAGADAAPAQAPVAAPAAKKRRVAKQPTMKQAFSAAVAVSGAAQARGSGIAAPQLLSGGAEQAGAPADAAHARAGGHDAERLPAGCAEAPQTQAQEQEAHAAPATALAGPAAAPLAAARAAATAAPIVFEHEVRPGARCALPRRLCASHQPLPPFCSGCAPCRIARLSAPGSSRRWTAVTRRTRGTTQMAACRQRCAPLAPRLCARPCAERACTAPLAAC